MDWKLSEIRDKIDCNLFVQELDHKELNYVCFTPKFDLADKVVHDRHR